MQNEQSKPVTCNDVLYRWGEATLCAVLYDVKDRPSRHFRLGDKLYVLMIEYELTNSTHVEHGLT